MHAVQARVFPIPLHRLPDSETPRVKPSMGRGEREKQTGKYRASKWRDVFRGWRDRGVVSHARKRLFNPRTTPHLVQKSLRRR